VNCGASVGGPTKNLFSVLVLFLLIVFVCARVARATSAKRLAMHIGRRQALQR